MAAGRVGPSLSTSTRSAGRSGCRRAAACSRSWPAALFGPAVHAAVAAGSRTRRRRCSCAASRSSPTGRPRDWRRRSIAFLLTASVVVVLREERPRARAAGRGSCSRSPVPHAPRSAPLAMAAVARRTGSSARVARRKRPGKQELFMLALARRSCAGGYLLLPLVVLRPRGPEHVLREALVGLPRRPTTSGTFCQALRGDPRLCRRRRVRWLVSTFGSVHERRALALLLLVVAGGVLFIVVSTGGLDERAAASARPTAACSR